MGGGVPLGQSVQGVVIERTGLTGQLAQQVRGGTVPRVCPGRLREAALCGDWGSS